MRILSRYKLWHKSEEPPLENKRLAHVTCARCCSQNGVSHLILTAFFGEGIADMTPFIVKEPWFVGSKQA